MIDEKPNFMIDERNKEIVTINDLEIIINGQKNKIIKIIGMNDVIYYADACTLMTKIIDDNNQELSFQTTISISKVVNNEVEYYPSRVFYADINLIKMYYDDHLPVYRHKTVLEWYRFKESIILNEKDELVIKAPNFKGKFSKEKTMIAIEACITEL